MQYNKTWIKVLYIIGVIALIIGIIDPLEGSIVILFGSILISLTTYLEKDRFRKAFLFTMVLIVIGVIALFYLSSLGGFGGSSDLSWCWGLFILPYPIGWIISIIVLIVKLIKRNK